MTKNKVERRILEKSILPLLFSLYKTELTAYLAKLGADGDVQIDKDMQRYYLTEVCERLAERDANILRRAQTHAELEAFRILKERYTFSDEDEQELRMVLLDCRHRIGY